MSAKPSYTTNSPTPPRSRSRSRSRTPSSSSSFDSLSSSSRTPDQPQSSTAAASTRAKSYFSRHKTDRSLYAPSSQNPSSTSRSWPYLLFGSILVAVGAFAIVQHRRDRQRDLHKSYHQPPPSSRRKAPHKRTRARGLDRERREPTGEEEEEDADKRLERKRREFERAKRRRRREEEREERRRDEAEAEEDTEDHWGLRRIEGPPEDTREERQNGGAGTEVGRREGRGYGNRGRSERSRSRI